MESDQVDIAPFRRVATLVNERQLIFTSHGWPSSIRIRVSRTYRHSQTAQCELYPFSIESSVAAQESIASLHRAPFRSNYNPLIPEYV
jgi:hypothetical protein